jgi:hypothetical protein
MTWDLHVVGPARKQLERMPAQDRERILAAFVSMRENPFQDDLQHLKNQRSAFRRSTGRRKEHVNMATSISRISGRPFAAASVIGGSYLTPIPAGI